MLFRTKPRDVDTALAGLSIALTDLSDVERLHREDAQDKRDRAALLTDEALAHELEAGRAGRIGKRIQELLA